MKETINKDNQNTALSVVTGAAATTLLSAAFPFGPLIGAAVAAATNAVSKASEKGVDELEQEVKKQYLQLAIAQEQARVSQEMAIAERIANSVDVEIEEFYDSTAKGKAKADVKLDTLSFGLEGEGKKVVRRIYRFTGNKAPSQTAVQSLPDTSADI